MTSRRRFRTPVVSSAILLLATALAASAGSPGLTRIHPPGAQRGTTVEVILTGRYLDDPREVMFYEPGIVVESMQVVDGPIEYAGQKLAYEPGRRVRVRLKIADECAFGPHGLRVRTGTGLTEYVRFFVGPFPAFDENETITKRNDKFDTALPVPANVTVHGRLGEATDVDMYKLEVKKGQRVSAEMEAARIGFDRGILDLHLTIYNAEGKKLAAADDSAMYLQDPILSVIADKDGPYFIEARHCMYAGTADTYRLHLGTFSRPTGIYPAGGQIGTALKVRILGDPKGEWNSSVALPKAEGDVQFMAINEEKVSAPSPNMLRASPFGNVLEVEPNDTVEATDKQTAVNLPIALNGIIDKPGDVDCFRFKAKKGEQFKIHAIANGIGSPVDPVIWVKSLAAKGNAPPQRATDSRSNQHGYGPAQGLSRETHDPIMDFTASIDGEYVIGIENERGEGGADHVYRIEVRPEDTAVYAYIAPEAENQNASQVRQTIAVGPGNRYTAQIAIFSTGRPVTGDLELVALNLPEGVTMQAPKILTGMTKVPVVFEASPNAKPVGALVDLMVKPVSGESLASGYRQTIMLNQYGNNDYYLHAPIAKLAVAVTEPAPFVVEVDEPKSSLVQNGEMLLKFRVIRDKDFEGPVTVQMDWRPNGLSTGTPVTVAAGQTEGTYILGAARNAAAGKHQVTLTAASGTGRKTRYDAGDRSYVASKPFKLTIAEPHVDAKIARTSIERGKTANIVCKLSNLQAFEGKAQVTLTRLPRGIELVEPMREITAADKEVTFTLRATPEALVGNYQGIVLDVTVTENGQPVRQLTGSGILRVDTERGPKSK